MADFFHEKNKNAIRGSMEYDYNVVFMCPYWDSFCECVDFIKDEGYKDFHPFIIDAMLVTGPYSFD